MTLSKKRQVNASLYLEAGTQTSSKMEFSTAGCKIPFRALSKNWALNLDWLDKLRNPHTCTARRKNAAPLTCATDTGEGLGVCFKTFNA